MPTVERWITCQWLPCGVPSCRYLVLRLLMFCLLLPADIQLVYGSIEEQANRAAVGKSAALRYQHALFLLVRRASAQEFAAMINDAFNSPKAEAARSEADQPGSEPARLPAVVLVAEDNQVNQQIARYLLQSLGYRVDIVATGHAAVAAATTNDYAAVLMDIQMPDMDGWMATAEIRKRAGTARRVPIIALTAQALDDQRETYLAAGMDDCLAKPLERQALGAMLQRWLAGPDMAHEPAVDQVPATLGALQDVTFDRALITKLRHLEAASGRKIVATVISLFLRATPSRLAVLRLAIVAGQADVVNQEAHALKGSCLNLGAQRMAGLCFDLEAQGQAGDLSSAASLLAAVEAEFEQVSAILKQERTAGAR